MANKFYAVQGVIFKGNSNKPPKSAFDLERYLEWQLNKLNVPFVDECCTTVGDSAPVRVSSGLVQVNVAGTWTTVGSATPAYYPDAAQNDITAGTGGAISVANYLTTINTDAGGDAFTLADGTVPGQMKKILLVVDGGGDGVVTPATAFAGGATTATFNDAADYLILMWNGSAWRVLENSGVTVA